ncbi:MAG: HNH endonuclease [Pseudomonadota bacterium]
MPRPADLTPLPKHEAVIAGPYLGRVGGRSRVLVKVRCPRCVQVRERTASEIRRELSRPNFRGFCRTCALAAVADGSHRWETSNGRREVGRLNAAGYAFIYPREVTDAELPMYRAMQRRGQPILAHRWAMAKHLRRALSSRECVDHMDGDKLNNDPGNLRIYVSGDNQPGAAPGYGTYYDEWQRALARVRELEHLLADLSES